MKRFVTGLVIGAVIASGSAFAATKITSRDIKNGTVKKIDFSGDLTVDTSYTGIFTGTGPAGDDAPAWAPPNAAGTTHSSQDQAQSLSPPIDLTASQLTVTREPRNEPGPLAPGQSVTVTLYVNGQATDLACSIAGGDSPEECGSIATVDVPPSSLITLRLEGSGGNTSLLRWSFVALAGDISNV
jgi:hypothetical protein